MSAPATTSANFDPFLLEILQKAFDAIADQMALILLRTSYSGIVRDAMDFSTAICDPRGRTLAQGVTVPMHLGSFFDTMQLLVGRDDADDGDVYICNDPYTAAGQHLPDIYIVKPIFVRSALVGWATTIAHHSDIGGIVAGGNALGATEIYQEGLRIPVVKFMERGEPNRALWSIIETNVRTPDKVMGDLQAQMAAATTGQRELVQLVERYGRQTVAEYGEHLHNHAERLARAYIAELPNGIYRFEHHIDGIGPDPEPVAFKVALTIEDRDVHVDWTGSSDQIAGGINSPLPFTRSCAYVALRCVMGHDVPNCHGYTRPIRVTAPAGSIMNPRLPGPTGARGITGYRMIDCLFGALAAAAPGKVAADGSGGATLPTISAWQGGKVEIFCECLMGSWGAAESHDGQDGAPHMGANVTNVPVEMLEREQPLRIEQYGLVADTGGAGRMRGGLSVVRDYRILAEQATLNVRSDKRRHRPYGLFGGQEGAPSWNVVTRGDHEQTVLPVLLLEPVTLRKGDLFHHATAGGGGYGDPLERDPTRVLQDVLEQKVTLAHAREAYGVVILDGHPPRLDDAATDALRRQRAQSTQ